MANYVLNRDYTLRSTSGVISFIKGEPTFVPKHMEREVVAIGAECVDGVAPSLVPETKKLQQIPQGEDRNEQIVTAINLLVERNDANDFTGSGRPTVKAVERLTGFTVEGSEVALAWDEVKKTLG